MTLVLHGYWRSSTSYRVRIALNLKGLPWIYESVSLVKDGGEHKTAAFAAMNPQKLVPVLDADGTMLTQSLAIVEYLEETYPLPPLLPTTASERAKVRALALVVACEIHPLSNLRVLSHLTHERGLAASAKDEWYRHWVREGMHAVEAMLAGSQDTGAFCHGEAPTLADVCLVPQVYNAQRYKIDLAPYPTIERIYAACLALPAFANASPENQPDAIQ